MLAMWAGFFALLVADRIDAVWSWLHDLPLVVELLIWVALFPWLREDSAPQCQQSSSHK
jgi:hypothetical protein